MEALPFIPGQIYNRRSDIHGIYGGNWQSGIATSASTPYIFIFTGKSGHQHGYEDGWDNPNVFSYTGEGQIGDMVFSKGNLALRDHILNGKRVFLFEHYKKGFVKFVTEVEVFDTGYINTHDRLGQLRIGIKFFFKRAGINLPYQQQIPFIQGESVADSKDYLIYNTEQRRFVNTRVGQGAYRKRIIHRWESKCAVTAFDDLRILIASHIVPWTDSKDVERLDVDNGILLSPTYDALFDQGLITFENSGKIILSEAIDPHAYDKIGVTGFENIKNLSQYNISYLDRHRQEYFR